MLVRGAEACLPSNLDDRWLHELVCQGDVFFGHAEGASTAALLASVRCLLLRLRGATFSEAELIEHVPPYYVELHLEKVGRRSASPPARPATLDDIFTDRPVFADS